MVLLKISILRAGVLANASDASAVTNFELQTSMRDAVQSAFDDSLIVAQSSGQFTIEDAQGRSLEIKQGEGTGYFFGTDEQNNGSLSTDANAQNNISVGWTDDGSELVVYHAAAGGVSISNYESTGNGVARFDVADTASSALVEPILLQEDVLPPIQQPLQKVLLVRVRSLLTSAILLDMQMMGAVLTLTLKLNISLKLLMEQEYLHGFYINCPRHSEIKQN